MRDREFDQMVAADNVATIRQLKKVAEITLCGTITLEITDVATNFIRPTEEQIKNLHDILCIDVKLFDD